MRAKAPIKKKGRQPLPRETGPARAKISQPVSLHRRSSAEFSCGICFERALLIEESEGPMLDEANIHAFADRLI
jgi:hypothetical protein